MNNKKQFIAITDDTKIMRCRILIQLIELANATPIIIPRYLKKEKNNENIQAHLKKIAEKLTLCDAIILPGNKNDVNPQLYKAKNIHPETEKKLPKNKLNVREETEIYMVNHALKHKKPLLGICGGMQIANITLGGSLIQHIPDIVTNDENTTKHSDKSIKKLTKIELKIFEENFKEIINNKQKNPFTGTHSIIIKKNSFLDKIYKKLNILDKDIKELSIHHQGCLKENLAPELKISAISKDGIIEAAEHKNHPKFILTQFHPECNSSGIALELVKFLINN